MRSGNFETEEQKRTDKTLCELNILLETQGL